ncbi:11S globulin [Linum perenne]
MAPQELHSTFLMWRPSTELPSSIKPSAKINLNFTTNIQHTYLAMAKLLLPLCLFALLFHASVARYQSQQPGKERLCEFDTINAIEPDNTVQAEAGTIETWDPTRQQFQCAGVAMVRRTIEPNGLLLPSYSNTPQLIYVIQGRGHTGIMFPGCPETFEESQQTGQQGYRDQHQKIRRFREGDVIAIPAGVAHWCYNDGNEPVVTVTVHDTSSHLNQLDKNNPRNFYLAGNPRDEFEQSQSQRKRELLRTGDRQTQGGRSTCNNLFCGMDSRALAEAFNIDENLARRLQSESDNRGSIIRVDGELDFVRPPTTMSEERQVQGGRGGGGRYVANGVEETFCSMRMRENIGDPSNADIFTPEAGRIRSINSHNLPVLRWIQLSAERGVLYNEAIRLPHWNINAHSIIYAIRGQARVQIVNENGNSVFDGVLQEGQVVTVPQNFAVVKRADSDRFEWVSFKTNDNAMVNSLAGRTSAIRAIPAEVLANAWQISSEEARRLKFNRQETHLASTRSQSFRAEA